MPIDPNKEKNRGTKVGKGERNFFRRFCFIAQHNNKNVLSGVECEVG